MRKLMLSASLPIAALLLWSCQSAPQGAPLEQAPPPPTQTQAQPAQTQAQPAQTQAQPAQTQAQPAQVAAAQPGAAQQQQPAERPRGTFDLVMTGFSLTHNGSAMRVPSAFRQRFVLQVRPNNMIRLNVFNARNGALISTLEGRTRQSGNMIFVRVTAGNLPPAALQYLPPAASQYAGTVLRNLPPNFDYTLRVVRQQPLELAVNFTTGPDRFEARLIFGR